MQAVDPAAVWYPTSSSMETMIRSVPLGSCKDGFFSLTFGPRIVSKVTWAKFLRYENFKIHHREVHSFFQGHLIILDLFSEAEPQYTRLESFYGHYYIWNMLHDFGGNNYMFGSLLNVTNVGVAMFRGKRDGQIREFRDLTQLETYPDSTCLASGSLWKASIRMRSCMNSLLNNHGADRWTTRASAIGNWEHSTLFNVLIISLSRLVAFVIRRYKRDTPVPSSALFAWQELGNSVYRNNPHGSHSLILRRPGLDMGQGVSYRFTTEEKSLTKRAFSRLWCNRWITTWDLWRRLGNWWSQPRTNLIRIYFDTILLISPRKSFSTSSQVNMFNWSLLSTTVISTERRM